MENKTYYEWVKEVLPVIKSNQKIIEFFINQTPTGEDRNKLCDQNIKLLSLIESAPVEPQKEDKDEERLRYSERVAAMIHYTDSLEGVNRELADRIKELEQRLLSFKSEPQNITSK